MVCGTAMGRYLEQAFPTGWQPECGERWRQSAPRIQNMNRCSHPCPSPRARSHHHHPASSSQKSPLTERFRHGGNKKKTTFWDFLQNWLVSLWDPEFIDNETCQMEVSFAALDFSKSYFQHICGRQAPKAPKAVLTPCWDPERVTWDRNQPDIFLWQHLISSTTKCMGDCCSKPADCIWIAVYRYSLCVCVCSCVCTCL